MYKRNRTNRFTVKKTCGISLPWIAHATVQGQGAFLGSSSLMFKLEYG